MSLKSTESYEMSVPLRFTPRCVDKRPHEEHADPEQTQMRIALQHIITLVSYQDCHVGIAGSLAKCALLRCDLENVCT